MLHDGDYAVIWFWVQVAQVAGTALIGVYTWLANRRRVTAAKFAKLEQDVSDRVTTGEFEAYKRDKGEDCKTHRQRTENTGFAVLRVETEMKHLPSFAELNSLSDKISGLNGMLEQLSGRLTGINRAVDLINEFLINKGP